MKKLKSKIIVVKENFLKNQEYLLSIKKTSIHDVDYTDILGYDLNKKQLDTVKKKFPNILLDEFIKILINDEMYVSSLNDIITNKIIEN